MPESEPWVTLKEIAKHLQMSEDTVRRWISEKGMPAHQAGRVWRFKVSQVDAWLESGGAIPRGSDDNQTT
jgi:excisionase family DNA binding protein